MKSLFHILRQNDNLNMQNNFLFVDTETKRVNNEEKFYLGYLIFWDRINNIKEYKYFEKRTDFFKYILKIMKTRDKLIIYAHNTDFDIKVLGGIKYLIKNGYEVYNFSIEGTKFILRLKNDTKIIEILDTMNYIPMSLKEIGKSIGLPKKEIDFNICTKEELKEYCKNDVEIIFLFIKLLIEFLEKYNLSKLKSTVGSLSLNIFRHKFYNKEKNPIYIHNWESAIELEKMSYKGGITDCFKIGNYKEKLFKLDVNSMYPYIMKDNFYPIKLLYYSDDKTKIKKLLYKYLDSKLLIARVRIFLPPEYAYILVKAKIKNENKSIFLSGSYETDLTTPELKFVIKYGKILEVIKLAIYEKSIIFKDFVTFFYDKRIEFSKNGNEAYKLFCKYILNNLYGKFGQRVQKYTEFENKEDFKFESREIIDGILDERYKEVKLGNKIFEIRNTDEKSFDSFIAIASYVTAYARMYLIEMILQAKRINLYYVDTDCLIVNKKGYDNLKDYINEKELGKLKLEETSINSTFYRPKYYLFNEKEKCKGMKKSAKILFEDNNNMIIEQEQFMRFKTSLNENKFDKQIVNIITKNFNKKYDKGIINKDNTISPYTYSIPSNARGSSIT